MTTVAMAGLGQFHVACITPAARARARVCTRSERMNRSRRAACVGGGGGGAFFQETGHRRGNIREFSGA